MLSIFGKLHKGKTTAAPVPAPNPFDALYVQAAGAATARDFHRAIQLYDQAIALDPSHAEAHYKRGNALKNLGRLDAAVASYDQAIKLKPGYAYAYCNRGVVQQSLGLTAAALSSYDQAIAYEATDAMAQYNRSLTSLFLGDFESGWRGFERRWENAQRLSIGDRRNFQQPLWLGEESIAGKRLLLYSEGGLGDTLQFCRYAALSTARGATVLLEVQAPLLDLLADLEGVSQLIAAGSPLPPFDYQCPLMSLPLAFKTTPDTIPAPTKYLHSDPAKVAQWRTRLGERTRPRIGLVWSGNPKNTIDQRRSIRLADWIAHLPPEFEYYCLQKGVREADQEALESSPLIFSFDDDSLDFTSTAALCECMDVVISVDTSIAHLSGALGRRTWVLLSFTPDWRWMLDRNDSPWYPTAKLYRQKAVGDWNEVFTRVAADLHREFRREDVDNPSA
jgi:hypothetical protein